MVSKIRQILELTKEEELKDQFGEFEDAVNSRFEPLQQLLGKDILSTDVPFVMNHMTNVERYRGRLVSALALADAFVSHCKSDVFIVPKTKGITDFERTAYQKKLTAGFGAMVIYLEGIIYSLDSRVNLCKKLLNIEESGFTAKIRS